MMMMTERELIESDQMSNVLMFSPKAQTKYAQNRIPDESKSNDITLLKSIITIIDIA